MYEAYWSFIKHENKKSCLETDIVHLRLARK